MKARVLCRPRRGVSLKFSLEQGESVIGRESGLAVSIPVEAVSRRHARIVFDAGSYWIEDLKSTNGTFLNGEPAHHEKLRHLDVVSLGKSLDLVFVLRSEEEAPATRPGITEAALLGADGTRHEIPLGEITLGRAPVCNVVSERGAVSKQHARIVRTGDQLILQDPGSANGTFVNGERVTTAVLRNEDEISLAGVESFRVVLEMGEVSASAIRRAAALKPAAPEQAPHFSTEWKTRFEWSSGELLQIDALREELAAQEQAGRAKISPAPAARRVKPPEPPRKAAAPPAPAIPAKPAPAAPKPAPEAKAKPEPAAPATPQPAPSVRPQPPAVAKPAPAGPAPRVPQASPPPAAPPEPPPSPQPPSPARPRTEDARPRTPAPPSPPPPAPPPAAAPKPPAPEVAPPAAGEPAVEATVAMSSAPRIAEVHLKGGGFDLVAREPGAFLLGRARDAALRVDHPTVSRKHARLVLAPDRRSAAVEDLGGANGTAVNGKRIEKPRPLAEGDRIRLGDVDLVVHLRKA